ncbi:hypothetical protein SAMN06265380_102260 [Ruegeria faecimaris]|uniref:Uncharacterized protein n=1 Tax=Ruegeria faecimaris TaxID=686389 RepID=A0A521C9K0_9RHOB|nr:hypothetical protein SAMN06265380_102260 [Ruegeria faecimaris]
MTTSHTLPSTHEYQSAIHRVRGTRVVLAEDLAQVLLQKKGGNIPPDTLPLIPMGNHIIPNRRWRAFHELGEMAP